jgi:pimeloyl-ACP methyl ester carboxylesterase
MQWLLRMNVKAFRKSPNVFIRSLKKNMPEPDRKLLANPEYADAVIRDMLEAYRNGFEGHLQDAQLSYAKNGWGFSLAEISLPVFIWHGERDTLSPIHAVQRMAQELPNCHAHYLADAGHLLVDHPVVIEEVSNLS